MINFFKKLFSNHGEKALSGTMPDDGVVETKKCTKCLKRVEMRFLRCPYCGSSGFYEP
jgi:hypothetical protein